MTMQEQYRKSHRIAKLIVCSIVVILLLLGVHLDLVLFDAVAVVIWFFGVNPVGYLVEHVLHFKHKHTKL